MIFPVPDGRAANHPFDVAIFSPWIGAWFPPALVSLAVIASPASACSGTASGDSSSRRAFCSAEAGASIRV